MVLEQVQVAEQLTLVVAVAVVQMIEANTSLPLPRSGLLLSA
jgi:hypothetical protein